MIRLHERISPMCGRKSLLSFFFILMTFQQSFSQSQNFIASHSPPNNPLSCDVIEGVGILRCTAQRENVRIDDVWVEDDLSKSCEALFYSAEEKQTVSNVIARLSQQERNALSSNPQATVEYLRGNGRFNQRENEAMNNFAHRHNPRDGYFSPLRKGDNFAIWTHGCPMLRKIDVIIDRQIYSWTKK